MKEAVVRAVEEIKAAFPSNEVAAAHGVNDYCCAGNGLSVDSAS